MLSAQFSNSAVLSNEVGVGSGPPASGHPVVLSSSLEHAYANKTNAIIPKNLFIRIIFYHQKGAQRLPFYCVFMLNL